MRRTIVELIFLGIGLGVAAGIAALASWAVPGIGRTIWMIAYVVMAIDVLLQIMPIRRAWRRDQAAKQPVTHGDG
jgi:hypothetical protein